MRQPLILGPFFEETSKRVRLKFQRYFLEGAPSRGVRRSAISGNFQKKSTGASVRGILASRSRRAIISFQACAKRTAIAKHKIVHRAREIVRWSRILPRRCSPKECN